MNLSHPYWTVATAGAGLVTLSVIGFIYCLTGWARARWRLANLQIQWALAQINTHNLEAEHQQFLAQEGDQH